MNAQELAEEADWEGGWYDALCGYGLTKSDLETDDPNQRLAWDHAVDAAHALRQAVDALHLAGFVGEEN